MASVSNKPTLSLNITLHLTDAEARALLTLSQFGPDQVLDKLSELTREFRKHDGLHTEGMRKLIADVRQPLEVIFHKAGEMHKIASSAAVPMGPHTVI